MWKREQYRGTAVCIAVTVFLVGGGACAAPSGGTADLTGGLWSVSFGPETYHWKLWPSPDGTHLLGVVHVMRDGKKISEVPVDQVHWAPPDLTMEMEATGVTYRGRIDETGDALEGGLYQGDRRLTETTLHRTDPATAVGLTPRPRDAGPWRYASPPARNDGWEIGDCAEAGLAHGTVGGIVAAVEAGDAGVIHSLLIVAGGRLVVEEYFHGWGPDDLHHLASVTKSVSSLLVGQAIDAGDIAGIDTPVLDFFPDLEAGDDPRWQDEKLRHVLGMCMGLDWDVADDGPHGTGPEFFQQVLNRSVAHDPGTDFEYRSANVNLLAGVLHQATGMHADRWAQERLFRPLGIENFDWSYLAVDGYRLMDGSLQLCPRDLAKLGMLLRDEGRWQGRPVVSPDWIRESTTPFMAADGPWRYGYLWWIGEYPTDSGPEPVVFARGRGSQFLVWMPVRDLIVVTTGGNEDNGKGMAVMRVLARHLFQG